MHRSIILSLALVIGTIAPASAWSLKTHVWISQQVLNDVTNDGAVTLSGRSYAVPQDVFLALRDNPEMYRMGNLGPDVFPDPVVGQTTTHPGVDNAWQTDDWLRHMVRGASTPAEFATAYGFLGHASSDIFAHTYVNAYAGDIFDLTDDEVDVERRHFVLEKYIESLTPVPVLNNGAPLAWGDGLDTASTGLRDLLILNRDASAQNMEAKTGLHLTAMYEARRAVVAVREATDDIIGEITDWGADTLKRYLDVQAEIASGKLAIEAAKATVDAQEALLDAEEAAHRIALDALGEANNIVQKYPELFTAQSKVLEVATNTATAAVAEAASVAADVANELANLQSELARIEEDIKNVVCESIPIIGDLVCDGLDALTNTKNKLLGDIANLRKLAEVANQAAELAKKVQREAKQVLDDLNAAHEKAVTGLANGTYRLAVETSQAAIELRRKQIEFANKVVAETEQLQQKLESELKDLTPIVDDIKEAIDNFNPVRLLLDNWIDGIDIAAEEYILASSRAGRDMLLGTGNPLSHYTDWWSCYSAVFAGVPVQIGQVTCEVKDFLKQVDAELDKAISQLPEILQWLLFPARKIKEEAMEELRPHLREAVLAIGRFVADDTLVDFLDLLVNPEYATRGKLIEVHSVDGSGKGLLTFTDVAALVDQDLKIQGGVLDVKSFAPLVHAVTLAKLSLLGPEGLNALIADLAPDYASGKFGSPVYPTGDAHFSLLFDAVRSIDGNHQWQAYGLPYPRRAGVDLASPVTSDYGYDSFKQTSKGMRIWADPYLRHRVFLVLFPQSVMGVLGQQPALADYPFPECPVNPFPKTQNDDSGKVVDNDDLCDDPSIASTPITDLLDFTADEYRAEFFACDAALAGYRHWTIVASFRGRASAERMRAEILANNPDLHAEVWAPAGHTDGRYWTVMLAACTDATHGNLARQIGRMRGISDDAFVWYDLPPWTPVMQ